MRGFLGANLFLLGIVLIGALLSVLGGTLVQAMEQEDGRLVALVWIGAGVIATIGTGYIGSVVHRAMAGRLVR